MTTFSSCDIVIFQKMVSMNKQLKGYVFRTYLNRKQSKEYEKNKSIKYMVRKSNPRKQKQILN